MKMLLLVSIFALFPLVARADLPIQGPIRIQTVAAKNFAQRNATVAAAADPACVAIAPFYWEVGNASGVLASGAVGSAYGRFTKMPIASASKWLYGAYVAQVKPSITADDHRFLHMSAGFDSFTICGLTTTVGACATRGSNGDYTAGADGFFYYGGGHMQQHAASVMGMGAMTATDLGNAVSDALGINVTYNQPMIAGGAETNAYQYGAFLRKTMRGALKITTLLGSNPVCTLPGTCPTALNSPSPNNLNYSFGHWVETDYDGAFSSPGAYGFYPWISADLSLYGIVARDDERFGDGVGWDSLLCGRAIRAAYQR